MPASDQGVFRDRYAVIPRVLSFLTRSDEILLLKGAPDKRLWANKYNGIGGHVERGEDVLTAARREIVEETGIDAKKLWLCAAITIEASEDLGIGMFVFRGELLRGKLVETREGLAEWVNISDLSKLPLVEDLPVLLPRILSLKSTHAPISAHYAYNADGKLIISFGM